MCTLSAFHLLFHWVCTRAGTVQNLHFYGDSCAIPSLCSVSLFTLLVIFSVCCVPFVPSVCCILCGFLFLAFIPFLSQWVCRRTVTLKGGASFYLFVTINTNSYMDPFKETALTSGMIALAGRHAVCTWHDLQVNQRRQRYSYYHSVHKNAGLNHDPFVLVHAFSCLLHCSLFALPLCFTVISGSASPFSIPHCLLLSPFSCFVTPFPSAFLCSLLVCSTHLIHHLFAFVSLLLSSLFLCFPSHPSLLPSCSSCHNILRHIIVVSITICEIIST